MIPCFRHFVNTFSEFFRTAGHILKAKHFGDLSADNPPRRRSRSRHCHRARRDFTVSALRLRRLAACPLIHAFARHGGAAAHLRFMDNRRFIRIGARFSAIFPNPSICRKAQKALRQYPQSFYPLRSVVFPEQRFLSPHAKLSE